MDVRFIGDGHGVDGHDIVGTADQAAGTMTLTCLCGRFSHTVHYRDDTIRAMSALADAGRDHLAFANSLAEAKIKAHPTGVIPAPVKLSECHPDCDWLTSRAHHEDCVT